MARIKNELTGRASGKVGQQIYRITNGITSLCALPASLKTSYSVKSMIVRSRFRLCIKTAKAMMQLSQLKYFWKNISITAGDHNSTPLNKSMKRIYPFVLKDSLDNILPIVPALGFVATKSAVTLANNQVEVELLAIGNGEGIDPLIETHFQLACIIYCSSAVDDRYTPYDHIWCISENIAVNLVTPLTISINLKSAKSTLFDMYATHKAYFTLISMNADGVPVRFSDTFTSV